MKRQRVVEVVAKTIKCVNCGETCNVTGEEEEKDQGGYICENCWDTCKCTQCGSNDEDLDVVLCDICHLNGAKCVLCLGGPEHVPSLSSSWYCSDACKQVRRNHLNTRCEELKACIVAHSKRLIEHEALQHKELQSFKMQLGDVRVQKNSLVFEFDAIERLVKKTRTTLDSYVIPDQERTNLYLQLKSVMEEIKIHTRVNGQ